MDVHKFLDRTDSPEAQQLLKLFGSFHCTVINLLLFELERNQDRVAILEKYNTILLKTKVLKYPLLVVCLIRLGFNPIIKHGSMFGGDTPLHRATAMNSGLSVRALLVVVKDIDTRGTYNFTPLNNASRTSEYNTRLLLDMGAHPDQKGGELDSTPIMFAAQAGEVGIVKRLLIAGASIGGANGVGKTVAHYSVECGNAKVCKFIDKHQSPTDAFNIEGNNVLHNAIHYQNLESIRYLLTRGVDCNVHAKDLRKTHPLHMAIDREINIEILKTLVKWGADINAVNDELQTPLHLATRIGRHDIMKYLVEQGANVNLKNKNDNTPLQIAISELDLTSIKILAENGADVNVVNNYSENILHRICVESMTGDRLPILGYVLTLPIDLNARDGHGDTPLHNYINTSAGEDGFQHLLKTGVNINIYNNAGRLPLNYAIKKGREYAPQLLNKDLIYDDDDINDYIMRLFRKKYTQKRLLEVLCANGMNLE